MLTYQVEAKEDLYIIYLHVEGELHIQCQRCLDEFNFPYDNKTVLLFVVMMSGQNKYWNIMNVLFLKICKLVLKIYLLMSYIFMHHNFILK